MSGDPAEELWRITPADDVPTSRHLAWHLRHADLWDQIAARDATLAGNAQVVADHHRRKADQLRGRS